MILGAQDFFYPVTDMARAVKFYTQTLGMKIVDSNPWWTGLMSNGLYIGLQLREFGRPSEPELPVDAYGAKWGGMLTVKSGNYLVDKTRLLDAGIRILGEHKDEKFTICYFHDTENNVLRLMHSKPH